MRVQDLSGHIDFDTFCVLAVIKRKGKRNITLLAPKNDSRDKYFNLQDGKQSLWYSSLENMLKVCHDLGHISTLQNVLIKYRYNKLIKKH